MIVSIRQATKADADGMSAVLAPILAEKNSTRPSDPAHVRARYICEPYRLSCAVAVDGSGLVLGFQSLKRAEAGNPYGVTPGWGIIGTYVRPGLQGQGIGRALFARSLDAARAASLPAIDATIGADNAQGLAYYAAVGFRTYRRHDTAICKRYDLNDV